MVGRDEGASTYPIEIANVATLEANAPVLLADVVVGSVSKLWTQDWHAVVEVKVEPDVIVPENAIGTVGRPACSVRCTSPWIHHWARPRSEG